MKKILIHALLLCLFFQTSSVSAQLSILFVDDSDDTFGNAGLFISAIESLGYSRTIYDAARTGSSPSDSLMSTFDLVIWHTSNGRCCATALERHGERQPRTQEIPGWGRKPLAGRTRFYV